jgi:arylsulfatase A-like enzyme
VAPFRDRAARLLLSPLCTGPAYVLALAARAGTRGLDAAADLGDASRAKAMEAFIVTRYAGEIRRVTVAIVCAALAIGMFLGILAELALRLRSRQLQGGLRRGAHGFALVVALHGSITLWAMARTPQLYVGEYYAQGSVWRTVQILATDVLGPRAIVVLGLLGLFVYLRSDLVHAAWSRLSSRVRRVLAPVGLSSVLLAPLGASTLAARAGDSAVVPSGVAPTAASTHGSATHGSATPRSLGAALPGGDARASSSSPMNVLFLAVDSLRADRFAPHTTPHMLERAKHGVVFERSYVSLPRTFSSWVTMLTGRHPHHHGIRSMFPRWEERAKDFDGMPKRFAQAGYRTGVVSDYAGDIFGRIDLGFGIVDTPTFDFKQLIRQKALTRETPLLPFLHSGLGRTIFPALRELPDAADPMLLAGDAKRALRTMRNDPFFLTVFFSTAHFPYAAPAPYYRKFSDSKYRGRFKYHKPVGLGQEAPPDAADIEQIRDLYDGAVLSVDEALEEILGELESLGLKENTSVVLTADHGENIFDHGRGQGHGDHVFGDEATHVPLVLWDPRIKTGRRERGLSRDVDIAKTLYELTGVPAPGDLDGQSLAPSLRGEPLPKALAYAESELWFTEEVAGVPADLRLPYPGIVGILEFDTAHGDEMVLKKSMIPVTTMARHRMVRDERYKLVYAPARKEPRFFLFDTQVEPEELTDVAAQHPADLARLQGELYGYMLRDRNMEKVGPFVVPKAEVNP